MIQAIETSPSMHLLSADEYPRYFIASADNARERIGMLAMVMTVDNTTRPMFDAVERAAERGVEGIILPDAYSREIDDNVWRGQLWTPEGRQAGRNIAELERRIGRLAAYETMQAGFVHPYTRLDKLAVYRLFARRNHVKSYDFDNTTHIGGIMPSDRYLQPASIDYALAIHHPGAADFMYAYKQDLLKADRLEEEVWYRPYTINDENRLVIDVGLRGKSNIYDTVRRLAEAAEEFTLVSQYPPKGQFRQLLADRPPDATRVFHNRPDQFVVPGKYLRTFETGLPPHLAYRSALAGFFIHAKLVLARLPDGTPVTVATSHNQQQSLVRMGTAEVALISIDPAVYRAFEHYLNRQPLEPAL